MLREPPPAAVVLDLDLATFDGFELLRLVSTDAELRGVPVVALSPNGDFATFEQAHRLGAAEFVTKPLRARRPARAKSTTLSAAGKQRRAGRLKLGAMLVPAAS